MVLFAALQNKRRLGESHALQGGELYSHRAINLLISAGALLVWTTAGSFEKVVI